mmetsp:Transcript_8279/g.19117  ORF Transcript_8279/g.19117 Transcript_8279/m.19117 type:complete len:490 (+) Transcript_8279:573-2042(+)
MGDDVHVGAWEARGRGPAGPAAAEDEVGDEGEGEEGEAEGGGDCVQRLLEADGGVLRLDGGDGLGVEEDAEEEDEGEVEQRVALHALQQRAYPRPERHVHHRRQHREAQRHLRLLHTAREDQRDQRRYCKLAHKLPDLEPPHVDVVVCKQQTDRLDRLHLLLPRRPVPHGALHPKQPSPHQPISLLQHHLAHLLPAVRPLRRLLLCLRWLVAFHLPRQKLARKLPRTAAASRSPLLRRLRSADAASLAPTRQRLQARGLLPSSRHLCGREARVVLETERHGELPRDVGALGSRLCGGVVGGLVAFKSIRLPLLLEVGRDEGLEHGVEALAGSQSRHLELDQREESQQRHAGPEDHRRNQSKCVHPVPAALRASVPEVDLEVVLAVDVLAHEGLEGDHRHAGKGDEEDAEDRRPQQTVPPPRHEAHEHEHRDRDQRERGAPHHVLSVVDPDEASDPWDLRPRDARRDRREPEDAPEPRAPLDVEVGGEGG